MHFRHVFKTINWAQESCGVILATVCSCMPMGQTMIKYKNKPHCNYCLVQSSNGSNNGNMKNKNDDVSTFLVITLLSQAKQWQYAKQAIYNAKAKKQLIGL